MDVPIIDLALWRGTDSQRADLVQHVDRACTEVGFLQVVNHGMPDEVLADMLKAHDTLFGQSLEAKLSWRPPAQDINRGYAAKGSESLSYSIGVAAPPDLFEAFNIGLDDVPDEDVYAQRRHDLFAENIWPNRVESVSNNTALDNTSLDVREALVCYFGEASKLAHTLTAIFAVALGLDEHFFGDKTDHSTDTMRMNNYVRQPGEPAPVDGQQRMGAHTDYGIVTVLYADRVAGLEIFTNERWEAVIPTAGALLINLGDLLAEWTNDRWRSTLHRVVPPPRSASGPVHRRSVAFFHDGNHDALVECLPTCVTPDRPAKYPPVLAGDHLMAKLMGPRTATESAGTINTAADRLPS